MSNTNHHAGSRTYSWTPDPTDGLSGDRYLSEEIKAHVDDLSKAHAPGVYVLELSTPDTTAQDVYESLWAEQFDAIPDYITTIADSNRLLYVGAAKSVYERIQEHLESPNRSTTVATVFPIHSIADIHWYDDPQRVFERETQIAMQLNHDTPDAYVHCR